MVSLAFAIAASANFRRVSCLGYPVEDCTTKAARVGSGVSRAALSLVAAQDPVAVAGPAISVGRARSVPTGSAMFPYAYAPLFSCNHRFVGIWQCFPSDRAPGPDRSRWLPCARRSVPKPAWVLRALPGTERRSGSRARSGTGNEATVTGADVATRRRLAMRPMVTSSTRSRAKACRSPAEPSADIQLRLPAIVPHARHVSRCRGAVRATTDCALVRDGIGSACLHGRPARRIAAAAASRPGDGARHCQIRSRRRQREHRCPRPSV
jgi:hypothetical protein